MTLAPISDRTYREALQGLAHAEFLKSIKYQEQQWRAERAGAWGDILDFEKAFVKAMADLKVPVFAHCVVRTLDEQARLFKEGRSKARGGDGPHTHGCAVDIIHSLRAWDMPKKAWAIFGHVGKEVAQKRGIEITWGGDWKFYDPAHWEITNWRNRIYVGTEYSATGQGKQRET